MERKFDKQRRFTWLLIFKPQIKPGHGHGRTAPNTVRKQAKQERIKEIHHQSSLTPFPWRN